MKHHSIKLAIYGTGGLGKETCYLAECVMRKSSEYSHLVFIDDTMGEGEFLGYPVFPFSTFASRYSSEDTRVVIAVGEPKDRAMLRKRVVEAGFTLGQLISPDLQITKNIIKQGCLVFSNCIIMPDVAIDENVVVQSGVILTHDDKIGKDTVICPRVTIGGNAIIGEQCFIGLSAVIRDHIEIKSNCIVGMGSVIVNSIEANSVVAGNPAKLLRKNITKMIFHK